MRVRAVFRGTDPEGCGVQTEGDAESVREHSQFSKTDRAFPGSKSDGFVKSQFCSLCEHFGPT
jgi:hypothetical protein